MHVGMTVVVVMPVAVAVFMIVRARRIRGPGVAEDLARAVGAAAALGGDAQLELEALEAHRAVGHGLADLAV
jgi:hypothetical protein